MICISRVIFEMWWSKSGPLCREIGGGDSSVDVGALQKNREIVAEKSATKSNSAT